MSPRSPRKFPPDRGNPSAPVLFPRRLAYRRRRNEGESGWRTIPARSGGLILEAAAAPNRDRRGEPPIIEGEVTARHDAPAAASEAPPKTEQPATTGASQKPPAQEAAEKPADEKARSRKPPAEGSAAAAKPAQEEPAGLAEPTPAKAGRARPLIAACLGGLVGAVVAGGIVGFERSTVDSGLSERLAALEAPINDLTRRVGALEDAAASGKAAADAVKTILRATSRRLGPTPPKRSPWRPRSPAAAEQPADAPVRRRRRQRRTSAPSKRAWISSKALLRRQQARRPVSRRSKIGSPR